MMKKIIVIAALVMGIVIPLDTFAQNYSIGAFYYPGWRSDYINWNDIKGLPGSRSPGLPWPDREPLLGFYPEEQSWVAEKHIEWASKYGVDFFAYDWYWDGTKPVYDHALNNYLNSLNRGKLQFCLLWANHALSSQSPPSPLSPADFDNMVSYWITNYFSQPTYYRLDGKPVVFIFSYTLLESRASAVGETVRSLLARANSMAQAAGYRGIYFIATTDEMPGTSLATGLAQLGFNAYSGWNYVSASTARVTDYDTMVTDYLRYYKAAGQSANQLPYIVPASPGWDSRPWAGAAAPVRNDSTPEKFERMLLGAKKLLDDTKTTPKVLMIEAWNEFGEGSYIEPTKKWGFRYLETIKKVFAPR